MVVIPIRGRKQNPSREQALRDEWAANLRDELDAKGLTVKQFHLALVEAGADVSLQAVYQWLSGTSAPSPYNQSFCGHVLRAPAHRLFPLPKVAS